MLSYSAVLAGTVGLAACGGSGEPSGSGGGGGALRYGEAGEFTTFNPWAQEVVEQSVANQMFSRLVYKTKNGKPVGDLAESWEMADDGKSITLHLRKGVKWQDGSDLVAKEFVTMFGYLSDPKLKADPGVQKMTALFEPVTAVKAPDPSTVVMEFSAPVPYVLDILNYWYAVRFPNPDDTRFFQDLPIGTGPFKMTKFVRGQSASFVAYPDYHVKGQPKVKDFTFFSFASGTNVVSNLQSGQVDGVLISNPANVKPLKQDPKYAFSQVRLGVWLVQINVSKPPFDKVEVRQALSYAMDREQFAKAAHFGLEEPTTSPFFTSAATGYVPELVHAQSFDLDKAKSLLDSAGVDALSISLPVPSSRANVQTMAEIWQSDLKQIGVSMSIHPVDDGKWISLGSGEDPNVDMVPWNVARCLQDGAVFFAANYGYSGGKLQPFGYRNPTMQDLIKQGATSTDPQKRQQIYQRLNRIVVNDAYNLSTTTFSLTWAWSSAVHGYTAGLAGNLMLAKAVVEK